MERTAVNIEKAGCLCRFLGPLAESVTSNSRVPFDWSLRFRLVVHGDERGPFGLALRSHGADYRYSVSREIISLEATGTEDEELRGFGDPSSNAEAMALKRAASKFGVGLSFYHK
jgi:hypothetical protein